MDTTILGLDEERAKEMPYIASMGIYVFSKNAMLNLLREKFPSANDFGSEVIPGATSIGLRVSNAEKLLLVSNFTFKIVFVPTLCIERYLLVKN